MAHFAIVQQARHIVDVLSITDQSVYQASHHATAQANHHFTQRKYPHNNQPHHAHHNHRAHVQKSDQFAHTNWDFHDSDNVKSISHVLEFTENGVSFAHLHLNSLFAKFTIFTAWNNSSQLANCTSSIHSIDLLLLLILVCCQNEVISCVLSLYDIPSKWALNSQKLLSLLIQFLTSVSTVYIAP